MKEKIGYLDFIKMWNLCSAKVTVHRMKIQSTLRENIFKTNIWQISDITKLVSKTDEEFLSLNINTTKQPIFKWTNNLNTYLTKENVKWQIITLKKAQHHLPILNCKLKQQWGTIELSEWLKSKKINNTKC